MIIDAHTHVWPDKIAEAALTANRLPGLSAHGDGTVSGLDTAMLNAGIGLGCCFAIANQARQVDRVNEFARSIGGPQRFPFGTVHVDLSVEENLASLSRHGLTAVKVHPLFQNFSLDHPRLWELFEAFGDQVTVVTHVGAGGSPERNALSNPAMIRRIVRQFPSLRLIACHFGGYHLLDDAEEVLDGVDVVLETSWPPSLALLRPDRIRGLIRRHGAHRVVFGSDWPMSDQGAEIAAVEALGLSDDETKAVLGGTMARMLGITSSWSA